MALTTQENDNRLRVRHEWLGDKRLHILITPQYRGWYAHTVRFISEHGSVALEQLDRDGRWYLTDVFTSPSHRKQGISTLLIRRALKEAKRRRIKTVRLWTTDDLIPFYRRFGFQDTGEFTIDKRNGTEQHYLQLATEWLDKEGVLMDSPMAQKLESLP